MHGRVKVKTTAEQEEEKRKEREKKLKIYKAATQRVMEKRQNQELDDELLNITAQILQSNPDYTTMWNIRREVFIIHFNKSLKKTVEDGAGELLLTEAALQKNPKSYGAWSHRAWAMQNFPDMDWVKELRLCNLFLDQDERNFHCWDYRRFVCTHTKVTAEMELAFTMDRIAANFSNYSAWHYRSSLLPSVHPGPREGTVEEKVLLEEYNLVQNATFTDPGDQSAWFYHRWLTGRERPALDFLLLYVSRETHRIILHLTRHVTLADTKISVTVNGSSLQLSWEAPCQSLCSSLWWCHVHEGSLPGDCTLEAVVQAKDNEFATATLFIAAAQKESKTTGNIPRNHLFSCELSAAHTSVLENELKTCRELHDLEPLNKWPLLTCVLLMRALDGCKFRMDIKKFLAKLTAVDPMRRNYYNDLNSKFAAESVIEQLGKNDLTADFSGQCLTSIHHTDHLALLHEVDFSRNQIKSTLPLGCLLSIRKLVLDDNCIETCEGLGSLNTLTVLSLRNNRICNKDCLTALKTCLMLAELNLEGNSMSKCKDHVEVLLPQVKLLDGFPLSS
ncbi:geranylgeranyl transferase type-2 subunit alpha [Rhipicephalus sanguineus]|uniref:geranylgeranyl transferase type-2 subunit alpha n=1 Tax=Rhipicephalus sanguineus TaxID=34632 RepID=UPI0018960777|nr:geranylgeranyl transferase type-2 subunit alpha [Rhipicephalus sanguineus]